jgi:predicted transcriptional regulator
MSRSDLRRKLHSYIEGGDKQLLNTLNETAETYMQQKELDQMIAEGEEDIKAGRTYNLEEVKKMFEN